MRAYTSILVCLLVAYYPCNAFFSNVWNLRKASGIDSLLLENDKADVNEISVRFEQQLDHFDPTNNNTWLQGMLATKDFCSPGKSQPVFLLLLKEALRSRVLYGYGTFKKYAEKYGAVIIVLEHRYYGGSQPTKDKSTENLKYLNSEQALADAAFIIESLTENCGYTEKNKWIVFGADDGGSLAAWLRYKYPHLVHAAVSSSGPLLAKTNFYEYFDAVRSSLNTYGEECSKAVTDAHLELHQLFKDEAGREKINKLFKFCSKLEGRNEKDEKMLFFIVAFKAGFVVEFNDYIKPLYKRSGIDIACDILTNKTLGDPLNRYASFFKFFSLYPLCTVYKYSEWIAYFREVAWDKLDEAGFRQELYQRCTQMGFFQTSEKETSLFGPFIDIKFLEDFCTDVFGPSFDHQLIDSSVNRTNTFYGGLNIKATRVAYVQGSLDPWHPLGITQSSNPEAPAIFINGTSRSADLSEEEPSDSLQLKEARAKISALIGEWLKIQ